VNRVNHIAQPQSRTRYPLVTEFGRFDRAAIILRAQEHQLSMEWAAALSKAYREASQELRERFNRTTTVPASNA
jgi:hypothetical protein